MPTRPASRSPGSPDGRASPAPIASATRVEQLNDLIEGARLELDAAAIERLDEASA